MFLRIKEFLLPRFQSTLQVLRNSNFLVSFLDLLLVEEVVNYTLGDLLSDIGGILGFFLGLSLLQVSFELKKQQPLEI